MKIKKKKANPAKPKKDAKAAVPSPPIVKKLEPESAPKSQTLSPQRSEKKIKPAVKKKPENKIKYYNKPGHLSPRHFLTSHIRKDCGK